MEKLRESLDELESMDPMEWHNIPKPIVHGVMLLKACVRHQTSFLDTFSKQFHDFEGRCNIRILNVQKSISENLEKIKLGEEKRNLTLKRPPYT